MADNRRDMLCGNWESVEGKPDVLIYKEGEAYKVTVFRRSGLRRKLKPETYLLQEENGNLDVYKRQTLNGCPKKCALRKTDRA